MSRLLIALLLCCAPFVLGQTQQQEKPEPSLADQARAAAKAKESAKHAKVVTDNDAVEEKKSSGGPFPDLGTLPVDWSGVNQAANDKAAVIVEKMAQFIATHPKDEAKRIVSDWFKSQEQTIKDLKQRKDQLDGFSYTGSTNYDSSGRIYSQAAALDHADRSGRDDVNRSLNHIETQLEAVRHLGAKRGILWSWMLPNERDVRDKPIIF
jgi:hypothetical protein